MRSGGWSLTTIATFATGAPFDVTASNTTGFNNVTTRGNRTCNGSSDQLRGNLRGDGLKWFDTTCFSTPLSGYDGNASRNVPHGVGLDNWNIGIDKSFALPLREGMRVQFRGEMFNAWNHAQFGALNALVTSPTFGLISSAGAPRLVQLALKLTF